jgi:hypothetical protein
MLLASLVKLTLGIKGYSVETVEFIDGAIVVKNLVMS